MGYDVRVTGQRIALTGLALAPALVLLPSPLAGLPLAIGLTGACSAYALLLSLRQSTANSDMARTGTPLLRGAALRSPPVTVPELHHLRAEVSQMLTPAPPHPLQVPPDAHEALRRALSQVIVAWGRPAPSALSRDELVELFILARLLRATPQEAGELAQAFRRPDAILDVRDAVKEQVARRAIFDRGYAAFEATRQLWRQQGQGAEVSLLGLLQALPSPDPDLWHHVVLQHDPKDPDQRAAALWCLRQRSCDRATVALYLSWISADGRLEQAARDGDRSYLDALREIVGTAAQEGYLSQELALSPKAAVAESGAAVAATLKHVSEVTGDARWSLPKGLFVEYDGRAPMPRAHWDVANGALRRAPDLHDYVDLPVQVVV